MTSSGPAGWDGAHSTPWQTTTSISSSGSLALFGDAFHNFMGMLFASANLVLCSRQVTLQQGS